MVSIKNELNNLIESSVTIAALPDEDRELLVTKLLSLSEDEMQQAVDLLKEEQKQQYDAMKNLVKKIESASNNLKKRFLQEKEKHEKKDSNDKAAELMEELNNID